MIPTALTVRETEMLTALAQDRRVYEAGALLGHSTVTLAKAARHVVSVDPHRAYPRHDPTPTWEPYLWNLQRMGVRSRVTPVRDVFQAVPVTVADLAWADLTGEYTVTAEFLRHTQRVPLVAVHDYARRACDGATRAVDEYIRRTNVRVVRVDTLIVLDKGST